MKQTLFCALTICLALTAAAAAQKQITLLATVTDPSGAAIDAIDPKDVRVTENDAAATVIKSEVVNRIPKVHLLIDNGVGIPAESQADMRKGLRGLVDALPPGIDVSVVTTAPQPRFLERGTPDRAKVQKGLDLLASDSGAGRFIESLYEATERIEKDKDSTNVIVAVASTSGDLRSRDSDIKKIMERVTSGRTKVHVLIFNGRLNTTLSGGTTQLEIGEAVAKSSGGRFETINATSRLVTVLPEIGADIAKTMGQGARQFRFTVDRPGGASGDLGKMTIGITGKQVAGVSLERR